MNKIRKFNILINIYLVSSREYLKMLTNNMNLFTIAYFLHLNYNNIIYIKIYSIKWLRKRVDKK